MIVSTNWDQRNGVPIFKSPNILSSFPIYHETRYRLRIGGDATHDRLPIDALIIPGKTSCKKLLVGLHGAIDRRRIEIPRFEWVGQFKNRDEHQLFIADTTLELADDLNLSWYIGTPNFDLIQNIKTFIEHVRLTNEFNEVVLVGSSGGGTAALAIGAELCNSCSIAFSPQTDVWKFTDAHSIKFKEVTFPSQNWDKHTEELTQRTDLIYRYSEGRHLNHFIYYQNTGDHEHVTKHWKRFSQAQGVRTKNGRSFNQQGHFISDFDGDGHCRPPTEKLNDLVNKAFELAKVSVKLVQDSNLTGRLFDHHFETESEPPPEVPTEWLYYFSTVRASLPKEGQSIKLTSNGVPLRIFEGVAYDHPVLQAQSALKVLNNISLPGSDGESAKAFAKSVIDHLLNYGELHDGGIFFPYNFAWHQNNLMPPWYSAMAQGQVLQLLCRYMNKTGSRNLLDQAHSVFLSFFKLRPLSGEKKGVTHIDASGFLWLEEYPYPHHNKFVLNGHIFAALGIYEYWLLTKSEDAAAIFNDALQTVRRYLPEFRNKGWSSHYDLRSRLLLRNYHSTHISLLEHLFRISGDSFFSRFADTLEDDFPSYQGGGSMYVEKGLHFGMASDNSRFPTKITDTKQLKFDSALAIPLPSEQNSRQKMEFGSTLKMVNIQGYGSEKIHL